jgi:hypothetical protein
MVRTDAGAYRFVNPCSQTEETVAQPGRCLGSSFTRSKAAERQDRAITEQFREANACALKTSGEISARAKPGQDYLNLVAR